MFRQIKLILAAIDINLQTAHQHMVPIEKVFSLSSETILNKANLREIKEKGYSRIPIYKGDQKNYFLGILLLKRLVGINRNTSIEGSGIKLRESLYVKRDSSLLEILNIFQEGVSHIAFVVDSCSKLTKIVGIITLEDILQSIIKLELRDECEFDEIIKSNMLKAKMEETKNNYSFTSEVSFLK